MRLTKETQEKRLKKKLSNLEYALQSIRLYGSEGRASIQDMIIVNIAKTKKEIHLTSCQKELK